MTDLDRSIRRVLGAIVEQAPDPWPEPQTSMEPVPQRRSYARFVGVGAAVLVVVGGVIVASLRSPTGEEQGNAPPTPATSGDQVSPTAPTTQPPTIRPAIPAQLSPGVVVRSQFGTHCGVQILGRVNGRWWRADEATRETAWLPPEWVEQAQDDEIVVVELVLATDERTITATAVGRSVVYTPGGELTDSEYCA